MLIKKKATKIEFGQETSINKMQHQEIPQYIDAKIDHSSAHHLIIESLLQNKVIFIGNYLDKIQKPVSIGICNCNKY